MNELISIIVPVFNVEKYLERCVDSLLNQTYKELEIILVDDCSTDNSPVLCDELAKRDERIKVIHKQNNEGAGCARNTGLDIASGDYIMFLDSDDYLDLKTCCSVKAALEDNNADICCFLCANIYSNQVVKNNPFESMQVFEGEEIPSKLLASCIAPKENSTKNEIGLGLSANMGIYKARQINENNIRFYSEREYLNEDVLFKIELFKSAEKIVVLPDNFYNYFHNSGTLSTGYNENRFEDSIKMLKKANELCKDYNCDELDKRNSRYFMINTLVSIKQEVAASNIKALKKIKSICNNETMQEVLCSYPVFAMPKAQKLFFMLIKSKMAFAVYLLTKIKLITDKKSLN